MFEFSPPTSLTIAFTVLTLTVVAADVLLVRRSAPTEARGKWTAVAAVAAAAWLCIHAGVAVSGVLERETLPPPAMPYLLLTMGAAVGVAVSRVGRALSALPIALLVGLQAFRLPLEMLLHALYDAGQLPVQMTWSGMNFDVVTAVGAIALAGAAASGRRVPGAAYWVWNLVGFGLLINVVAIALLSAPLPIRQFMEDPPVVLVFHAPYNWIVNVHVWTALVGHLVIFRALWRTRVAS